MRFLGRFSSFKEFNSQTLSHISWHLQCLQTREEAKRLVVMVVPKFLVQAKKPENGKLEGDLAITKSAING